MPGIFIKVIELFNLKKSKQNRANTKAPKTAASPRDTRGRLQIQISPRKLDSIKKHVYSLMLLLLTGTCNQQVCANSSTISVIWQILRGAVCSILVAFISLSSAKH